MPQRQELIKGSADCLLLCPIGQQSMYGYQINKELERRSQWRDFLAAMNLIIQPASAQYGAEEGLLDAKGSRCY